MAQQPPKPLGMADNLQTQLAVQTMLQQIGSDDTAHVVIDGKKVKAGRKPR